MVTWLGNGMSMCFLKRWCSQYRFRFVVGLLWKILVSIPHQGEAMHSGEAGSEQALLYAAGPAQCGDQAQGHRRKASLQRHHRLAPGPTGRVSLPLNPSFDLFEFIK